MLYRIGVGQSRESFAGVAESGAGDDRASILIEQSVAEIVARESESADIRVNVECAFGLEGFKSDVGEALSNVSAAVVYCSRI